MIVCLLVWLTTEQLAAQDQPLMTRDHPIYKLDARLRIGDKSALSEIAPYFDSKKKVIELLGYHRIETTESAVAKRVVRENSLFTSEEFIITDSSSTKLFTNFLNANKDKVGFSKLATSFLITPLDKRAVAFEIRAISENEKKELQDSANSLLQPRWIKYPKIDSLVKEKSPLALLIISSEFYRFRNRFNEYYYHEEEFINLLKFLTGTEIGVENEKKKISWHIDKDYYSESRLNLLIYFSKFYAQYTWDDRQSVFLKPNSAVKLPKEENILFQLLNNKNDSIAINAFVQLSVCDTEKVSQLINEYEEQQIEQSRAIRECKLNCVS